MRIFEIFESINGEVTKNHQGSLCTFIRMAGCNFYEPVGKKPGCSYCDTKRSWRLTDGKEMKIKEIMIEVGNFDNQNITITGGEPLLQERELKKLVKALDDYQISIETNGSYKIPEWADVVCWVADWKGPSSGMRDRMDIKNFSNLTGMDFIKFVIVNEKDFLDAIEVVEIISESSICNSIPTFAFSPCMGMTGAIDPKTLIKLMAGSSILKKTGAILNYQIHKLIDVA